MELTIVNIEDELLQDKNCKFNLLLYFTTEGELINDGFLKHIEISKNKITSSRIAKIIADTSDKTITKSRKILEEKKYLTYKDDEADLSLNEKCVYVDRTIANYLMKNCTNLESKLYLMFLYYDNKGIDYIFTKSGLAKEVGYASNVYTSVKKVFESLYSLEKRKLITVVSKEGANQILINKNFV